MFGCRHSTVQRYCNLELGASWRSEVPRKQDCRTPEKARRRDIVDRLMSEDSVGTSSVDVWARLDSEYGIVVSLRTVMEDLYQMGWQLKKRPRCPNMRTPERMAERLVSPRKC